MSFEFESSLETSALGRESSIETAETAYFPSSPCTCHFGGSTTFMTSVFENSSLITFNVDSLTSFKNGQIGSPTNL